MFLQCNIYFPFFKQTLGGIVGMSDKQALNVVSKIVGKKTGRFPVGLQDCVLEQLAANRRHDEFGLPESVGPVEVFPP